jgi:hypothetical protein
VAEQIVTTPTNTGSVANRKVFGVSGNNYLFLVGGGLLSLLLVHLTMNVGLIGAEWGVVGKLAFSFAPGGLAFLYVYGFLEGKEPYYQSDAANSVIEGNDFNVTPPKTWGHRPLRSADRDHLNDLHRQSG